jgi:GNAT superfamily N-acetyltransferase
MSLRPAQPKRKLLSFTDEDSGEVMRFCHANAVELLVARCDAADYRTVHVMEKEGGRLMDTLVYFSRLLDNEILSPDTEGVVAPAVQHCDVYHRLLRSAMSRAKKNGAGRLIVSTQVTNYRVQRSWVRAGFEPYQAYCNYHVWF